MSIILALFIGAFFGVLFALAAIALVASAFVLLEAWEIERAERHEAVTALAKMLGCSYEEASAMITYDPIPVH